MSNPDSDWVEAARHGDHGAAARLVREFQGRLYAFLRRLAGTEADAVELTQRTFCRAWSALPRFEGRASVSSWLHGIAYRTYVDWRRSGQRFEARAEAWWLDRPDDAPTPDVVTAAADTAAAV